jgi:hypothetical protein
MERWRKIIGSGYAPLIRGNRIVDNKAERTGGGIDVYYFANARIINNLIVNNLAEKYGGAIEVLGKASAELIGNSFIKNRALKGGGALGLFVNSGRVKVSNSVFAFNRGEDTIRDRGRHAEITHSCFFENEGTDGDINGNGNIYMDPLFVTGKRGDYYLSEMNAGQSADSPCLDAGKSTRYDHLFKKLTTRTDNVPDNNRINMGYHFYP